VPKVVVIGESGQLAQSLRTLSWPSGFSLSFHGRNTLRPDMTSALFEDLLRAEGAHLVLNAAAYTAVDRAESEPQAAARLNAELPQALAAACGTIDIPLVHVSTDYVFDGRKGAPYIEADAPNPLSVYGRTKLEGDLNVARAALPRWATLRASWVVSDIGETFLVKVLRRARSGEPLRVVDDQWGCPTAASDLARAMQGVGLRLLERERAACGLFNFCGASEMSWHGLTERTLTVAERLGLKPVSLHAIRTSELNAPARRPAYSVLSCARIKQACGISGTAIEANLERMVQSIMAS
jgi:dTDP-4-dehydrorhamnose reductase